MQNAIGSFAAAKRHGAVARSIHCFSFAPKGRAARVAARRGSFFGLNVQVFTGAGMCVKYCDVSTAVAKQRAAQMR